MIPVLLYHSVSDVAAPALTRYTVGTDQMKQHAAAIVDQGCTALTVAELSERIERGVPIPDTTVAITFDDGFADTAEHAASILSAFGLRATLYVTTGSVGGCCGWLGDAGRRPMASWSQLRDLSLVGWEIGAHSVDHPELDMLRTVEVRDQVRKSRFVLQDRLGLPIDSFAYPHGYHSVRVRDEVIAAGFRHACAVKNAMSSANDDPFARARLTVTSDMTAEHLAQVLRDARAGRLSAACSRERVRTKAWRFYRRARRGTIPRREGSGT